ncbi:MAG: RimK family alpha-L-glutamate ligase [Firmicutes bacterium]|nr:RimK family alpha-L-glutamate ligase [Bacillota bacterium]
MKGLIVTNAFFLDENLKWHADRFIDEFKKLNVETEWLKNDRVLAYLNSGKVECGLEYDFVLYLDKDIHICRMLDRAGLKVFNGAKAIEVCDDKLRTYIELSNREIKMPKTISSPLYYGGTDDGTFIRNVLKILNFPIIIKECYGSLGMQVYKADNINEINRIREKLIKIPHLYQEYIGEKTGQDVRVIVIGKKAVACMKRISKNDFRSNAGDRTYEVFSPDTKFLEMAERVSEILNLDYCGVDMLFDENGAPVLCEVNSNAFFNKIESVTKANIAKTYAEYILKKLKLQRI